MTLADQIASDVGTVFLNTDDFACSITFRRGNDSVPVDAVTDSTIFEVSTTFGITRVESRDYLIEASTLILDGVVVVPGLGDTITEAGRTYTVTAPEGIDVFTYDDDNRLLLRVHTVLSAN